MLKNPVSALEIRQGKRSQMAPQYPRRMFKKAVAPARRVPGLQRARRRGVLFAVR